jgi:hypothetical protein
MTPSKITVPLFLGIAGTIGFNLAPIVLGYGMMMNVCFMLYAGTMLFLSFADRRVLGYATVISACNPANGLAYLSYSFLLAGLTIGKEILGLGQVIWELGKRHWWWFLLAAFMFVWLSVPSWPIDQRAMLSEVKQALSRLGYLVAIPLAVGLTLRTPQDGVRAVSLLCLMSVAFFFVFFYFGNAGMEMVVQTKGEQALGLTQSIGNIYLGFNRTGVCIPLAALAACALALGVSEGISYRAVPFYVATAICVFMIMQLASVGSALAMAFAMGIVVLGYFGVRLSFGRILLGTILFSIVGSALYWAVFSTENALSKRIVEKTRQFDKIGIDRMNFWQEGLAAIYQEPFGEGWTTRTGHSDWLLYLLSYGWASGLFYIAAAGWLFLSMWGSLRRNKAVANRQSSTLLLVGLAVLSVYGINSILDMLSADIGYYITVWALILTSAAVAAVSDATVWAKKTGNFGFPAPAVGKISNGVTQIHKTIVKNTGKFKKF